MDMMMNDESLMLQDLVQRFVERELMPLEAAVLRREAETGAYKLLPEEEEPLLEKCRELGLWGLDVPEEMGGVDLSALDRLMVEEEVSRTITPFEFPPDSPNLHMLKAVATPEQREKYMIPYAEGRMKSCIAISEPGAGGDPAGMITRAVKDGSDWVINGRKIWVSRVPYCDFIILMARTGEGQREEGVTAFIVEKNTPGFIIEREIAMIGGKKTYELVFEDCRVPDGAVLGELGRGYAPMQLRLNIRRLQVGARCVGIIRRALEMMVDQANNRTTFGVKLADRQAIQWWIADAAIRVHALRLMVQAAARTLDSGGDVRNEASMIKVFATETAQEVLDHAMQCHGAMGLTKELPLQLFFQQVRLMRVYEGPTEVHRMAIARRMLKSRR
ncbi:acyl-CoA dehydrogenase family protein [Teichococcus vastitatis]|uniref:Acyl-CoA/acyl-ACP dehydrogenase n=1 Tax=Teichococcus vastitatis TaxID=2307076 RepID=A0ABS9W4F6_9PROT|nr:acyl-CoA dehydrogenase family protein [Pseudoroseomonas vastitatis]MCI0753820.1 acyl-CoA/acyl-ACP dehydrogenase [Pseudoroseomonas vastitatis]